MGGTGKERKMGVKDWLYEECPCGSGKKLKFCCWQEVKDEVSDEDGHDRLVEAVRHFRQPEGLTNMWESLGRRDVLEGVALAWEAMKEGNYKGAVAGFRKARKFRPGLYAAWNNEALALWMAGKRKEARRVVEEGLEKSGEVNAYGWGMLSEICYGLGDAKGAEEAATRGASMLPVSRDAASKVASALTLLGRDEEVLRYVNGCGFEEALLANFHAGVAAANLGHRDEALKWLRWSAGEHESMDKLGEVIAADLKSGRRAEDLPEGRWPHWDRYVYDLGTAVQSEAMSHFGPEWSSVLCDLMSMTLYRETLSPGDALALLRYLDGPFAEALRGRLTARGAKETAKPPFETRPEAQLFFVNAILQLEGRNLHTFEFTDKVPEEDPVVGEDLEAYADALDVVREKGPRSPKWAKAKATMKRLLEGHPMRYRVRLNYATMLSKEGKIRETKEILEEIFEEHPDYGHAAAGLLRMAVNDDDMERAEEICKRYRPAKKMLPMEYVDWLDAQEQYMYVIGKDEAATNIRKIANDLRKEFGLPDPPPAPEPNWNKIKEMLLAARSLKRRRRWL